MARIAIPFAVQDEIGNALAGTAYVYERGTSNQANAYTSSTGGTPLTQPVGIVAGKIPVWVPEGSYDIAVTTVLGSYTQPWEAALFHSTSTATPSNLYVAGHSYTDPRGIGIINGPGTNPNPYSTPSRIASALGVQAGQVINLAASGAAIRAHTTNGTPRYLAAINPGQPPMFPQIARTGVTFSWFGTNDLILGVGSLVQIGMMNGYRSLISRMRASWVADHDDASVTKSGTWTEQSFAALAPAWGSGTGCWQSSTVNDYIEIDLNAQTHPCTGLSEVTIALGFITATTGGTVQIKVDGVVQGSLDTFGGTFASSERGANVFRVTVGPSASKIRATITSLSGGGPVFFNYWQVEAPQPPLFLIGEITVPPNPPSLWAGVTPAHVDTANGWLQSIVTEFNDPSVALVPLDDALGGQVIRANGQGAHAANFVYYEGGATLVGLHPNERGAQVVARQVVEMVRNAAISGAQLEGFSPSEHPPLTSQAAAFFYGSGQALALLDSFDVADQDTTPAGWTVHEGTWGIRGKQVACLYDQFLQPVFEDTFQRANGAVGNGWTVVQGNWGITSNELQFISGDGVHFPTILSPQQLNVSGNGSVEFIAGSTRHDNFCMVFRYQDANNYWRLRMFPSFASWSVDKVVGGVVTGNIGGPFALSTGARMHVELNGSSIKVWGNGTLKLSITDTDLQTQRGTGLLYDGLDNSVTTVDDFRVRSSPMDTTDMPGFNCLVRDIGATDGVISFTTGADAPVNFAGIVFRYTDKSNYMTLYESASFGGWVLTSVIADVSTNIASGQYWLSNTGGAKVAIKMLGNDFTVLINDVVTAAGTQIVASAPTGTKLGPRFNHGNTLPNRVLGDVSSGGSAVTVPDFGVYEDVIDGKRYFFQNGVSVDSIVFLPTDGANVKDLDTTGLTSAQIDALFLKTPTNGRQIIDSTNHLVLVRQGGKWYKTAALTLIA